MNANRQENDFLKVYSLRVRIALREKGFEPLFEEDNIYKHGLKCWTYQKTPDFIKTFDEIMRRG